jgi:hypothetical protein
MNFSASGLSENDRAIAKSIYFYYVFIISIIIYLLNNLNYQINYEILIIELKLFLGKHVL